MKIFAAAGEGRFEAGQHAGPAGQDGQSGRHIDGDHQLQQKQQWEQQPALPFASRPAKRRARRNDLAGSIWSARTAA